LSCAKCESALRSCLHLEHLECSRQPHKTFVKLKPRTAAKSVLSEQLRGKPLIEPSVPAAASRAAPPLRNRIDPMEEEGAVGQRSRRSPSPRRSPPAVEGVLVGDEGGDIESRPTHVTWEEWAMSGNDARYDADSAVLVAAKQKAALQEHAKMQWLACFDSALSAAEVGLERVGVDAD